jgi:glycosyltransferase involved in cell wall biosynthesis
MKIDASALPTARLRTLGAEEKHTAVRPETIAVTVVVVCFNAAEHIHNCVTSLLQQTYEGEWELVVVDNGSTDGTRTELDKLVRQHDRLRIFDNPVRGISVSRNIGWQQARFPYVAYTDADCVVPPQWLSTLASGMLKYDRPGAHLAAVGGGNVPPAERSLFYQAHAIFLNSYLGSHGSVQGRRFSDDRSVPHLPTVNVLYKRTALQSAGGFDARFYNIGEDRDLSYRLQASGYTMCFLADSVVTHYQRSGFRSWFRNMFVYGKGRAWLMRRHPRHMEAVLLAPMILTILLMTGFWTWPLLLAYALFLFIYAGLLCARSGRAGAIGRVWLLFLGTHICYGLGQWYGVFRNRPQILDKSGSST